MQPTQIGLGNGVNSQNLLKLEYEYGSTTSVNNGNVTKQTITVPSVAHSFIQTYAYDELNRLTNAEEMMNAVRMVDPQRCNLYLYAEPGIMSAIGVEDSVETVVAKTHTLSCPRSGWSIKPRV
jgi:hypothetical protein